MMMMYSYAGFDSHVEMGPRCKICELCGDIDRHNKAVECRLYGMYIGVCDYIAQ